MSALSVAAAKEETGGWADILSLYYRVSRKKVYPFTANLVNIEYKDWAHLSHTIGKNT